MQTVTKSLLLLLFYICLFLLFVQKRPLPHPCQKQITFAKSDLGNGPKRVKYICGNIFFHSHNNMYYISDTHQSFVCVLASFAAPRQSLYWGWGILATNQAHRSMSIFQKRIVADPNSIQKIIQNRYILLSQIQEFLFHVILHSSIQYVRHIRGQMHLKMYQKILTEH